jgi:hypothetical protein
MANVSTTVVRSNTDKNQVGVEPMTKAPRDVPVDYTPQAPPIAAAKGTLFTDPNYTGKGDRK